MSARADAGDLVPRASLRRDVVEVARDLLGKVLVKDGVGGVIIEAEAYHQREPASHAHRGRTRRNRSLFLPAGHLYVYRIHQARCCNVTTGEGDVGEAVLVRALLPTLGTPSVARRRRGQPERAWTDGPGKLCQALGIALEDDGQDLLAGGPVRLLDRGHRFPDDVVQVGPRVGISKAQDLPWRFRVDRSLAATLLGL